MLPLSALISHFIFHNFLADNFRLLFHNRDGCRFRRREGEMIVRKKEGGRLLDVADGPSASQGGSSEIERLQEENENHPPIKNICN